MEEEEGEEDEEEEEGEEEGEEEQGEEEAAEGLGSDDVASSEDSGSASEAEDEEESEHAPAQDTSAGEGKTAEPDQVVVWGSVKRVEVELVIATIGTLALSCPRASHASSSTTSEDNACGGGIQLASDLAANSRLLSLLQSVGAYECWRASDSVATTHLGARFMCALPCHRRRFRKSHAHARPS